MVGSTGTKAEGIGGSAPLAEGPEADASGSPLIADP